MQDPHITQTLHSTIRDVPDFPKPGILFKDITPVLADPDLLDAAIEGMIATTGVRKIDKVVGVDARGFIFGSLIARKLHAGFIPVRKKGKLPWQTHSISYDLEYGSETVEIHKDAILPGETVLLADDLLATGGTAHAALQLIEKLGGRIACALFFIELQDLAGRKRLEQTAPVHSLLKY
jgi:adenine phosphoribosyltransferase